MNVFDPKKPRFRKDKGTTIKLVNRIFFKLYRKRYKNTTIDTYDKMRKVMAALHEKITDVIATERGGFDLAHLVNIVTVAYNPTIEYLKTDYMYVDYKTSRENNTRVKYTNLHTDGKSCKIYFSMELPKYKFAYRSLWSFTACLPFRRKVSREFSKNYLRFIDRGIEDSMKKVFQTSFK